MSATHAFDGLLEQAMQQYMQAPAESLRLADQAITWLGDTPDPTLLTRALVTRAVALSYLGDYPAALKALEGADALVPEDATALRVRIMRTHTLVYHEMGAFDTSLQWAVRTLDAARDSADADLLTDALLSIGVARSVNGDTAGGLHHYEEVLAIYLASGRKDRALHALNNIGIAHKNLGQYEASLTHLHEALAMAQETQDAGAITIIAANLGEPLWRLGRIDEARHAMEDAVGRARRSGYPGAEVHAGVLLGELLAELGETDAAQAELERAIALTEQHRSTSHRARGHKALAALHKAAGRFEAALQHFEAFHAVEQGRFNEDAQRKLRALQVQYDLARAQQEAQRARLEAAELAVQSRTDALTGLGNRRQLDERLGEEFARARRQGHALALAMVDIDDFKRINDTHGHTIGDGVLRTVATLLRQHCRAIDLVARYGGEEFCVVFLESEGAWALRACEAMRSAVEQHPWGAIQPGLRVTLSIGLTDRGRFDQAEALLAQADALLYEAKRGGKNRVATLPE